jgi:hypothetical protein
VLLSGLIAAFAITASVDTGAVGSVVLTLCAVFAVHRCIWAVWRNERDRFTTWRLGVPLAALLAVGAILKLAA